MAFVSEAIRAFGPRNCLIAGTSRWRRPPSRSARSREPWQLYAANAVLAFGWAGTSLGMITNTLGLWFDKKRGMAISLALNGASFGGIVGVPLLVAAIGAFRFLRRDDRLRIALVVLMVPVILLFVGRPPFMPAHARGRRPPMRRRRRRSARGRSAISASSRYRLRSRWCCSRRSASSFT